MGQETEGHMITSESVGYELRGRFEDLPELGKTHFSVRYEPGPSIVRVGACITNYDWANRMRTIERMLAFEAEHADEFAVEFDVVPLEPVQDEHFAEA
jgi:hypothetical protein